MSEKKSAYQRLLEGETVVLMGDEEGDRLQVECERKLAAFNLLPQNDIAARIEAIGGILAPGSGTMYIKSPFFCDYGVNIKTGKFGFMNINCTILDGAKVTIGDYCAFGPGCMLLATGHPVKASERTLMWPDDKDVPFRPVHVSKPITIGNYCWLGAGVIVVPGVTIGDRVVVGAGSVVTKDVPSDVLVAGNPARVIRQLLR